MLIILLQCVEDETDRVTLEKLYLKYKKTMLHVAMNILHDQYLSEDALHKAFIRLIGNLNKLTGMESGDTKAYLIIIIRNVSIDMLKKKNSERFISLDDIAETVPDKIDIEKDYNLKEENEMLYNIVSELPDIYKDVFLLRYYNGLSIKEISQSLDISVSTVKKRLERARKRIKSSLDNYKFTDY